MLFLSACWDTPREQAPPGADTPPGSRHPPWEQTPPAQCMLGDMVNKWAVCILLECNLVVIMNLSLLSIIGKQVFCECLNGLL